MTQITANSFPPHASSPETNQASSTQAPRVPAASQGNTRGQTTSECMWQEYPQTPVSLYMASGNGTGVQTQGEARSGRLSPETGGKYNSGSGGVSRLIPEWLKQRNGKPSKSSSTRLTQSVTPNAVSFEETGARKSSDINMLEADVNVDVPGALATQDNTKGQATKYRTTYQEQPSSQYMTSGTGFLEQDDRFGSPPASSTRGEHGSGSRAKHRAGKPSKSSSTPLFQSVTTDIPNIVIFGETGTGKSSVINMLADAIDVSEPAKVSNSALGCTFESTSHDITIDGARYIIWDTAGLNEGDAGNVPADQALDNLRDLVNKLKDGISLLVYCIRGSRYRDILKVNYDLFTQIICQESVPVVVVITGLENESPMDSWWIENSPEFTNRGINFKDHACITASRGKKNKKGQHIFEEEYEESKVVVRDVVKKHCPPETQAWRVVDQNLWLERIARGIQKYYEEYNGYSQTEDGEGREGRTRRYTEIGGTRGGASTASPGMGLLYTIGLAVLKRFLL